MLQPFDDFHNTMGGANVNHSTNPSTRKANLANFFLLWTQPWQLAVIIKRHDTKEKPNFLNNCHLFFINFVNNPIWL